jgi:hypothetical protein
MRWFRTRRSFGSGLALFALALQLALSFGHVHLDKVAPGFVTATAADAKTPASQPSPPQHPASDADDYCAICATIHLASTSFLPDAPQLPLPFVSQTVEHSDYVAFVFIAPQRTAFQSRAPPIV